jgi:hypothetical protein
MRPMRKPNVLVTRIHFFPPRDPHTLFIKTIPPSCPREELLAVISKVEGGELRRLIIGQPNPYKYFHRVGWITYTSDEACEYALKNFNNYKVSKHIILYQCWPKY